MIRPNPRTAPLNPAYWLITFSTWPASSSVGLAVRTASVSGSFSSMKTRDQKASSGGVGSTWSNRCSTPPGSS